MVSCIKDAADDIDLFSDTVINAHTDGGARFDAACFPRCFGHRQHEFADDSIVCKPYVSAHPSGYLIREGEHADAQNIGLAQGVLLVIPKRWLATYKLVIADLSVAMRLGFLEGVPEVEDYGERHRVLTMILARKHLTLLCAKDADCVEIEVES